MMENGVGKIPELLTAETVNNLYNLGTEYLKTRVSLWKRQALSQELGNCHMGKVLEQECNHEKGNRQQQATLTCCNLSKPPSRSRIEASSRDKRHCCLSGAAARMTTPSWPTHCHSARGCPSCKSCKRRRLQRRWLINRTVAVAFLVIIFRNLWNNERGTWWEKFKKPKQQALSTQHDTTRHNTGRTADYIPYFYDGQERKLRLHFQHGCTGVIHRIAWCG